MIASCPSCGTLYRQPARNGETSGRCSCCRGVVHLAVRRPYALVNGASSTRAITVEPVGVAVLERASEARADGEPTPLPAVPVAPAPWTADGPDGVAAMCSTAAVSPVIPPSDVGSVDVPIREVAPAAPGAGATAAGPAAEAADLEVPRPAPRRGGAVTVVLLGATLGALGAVLAGWWVGGSPLIWWGSGAGAGAVVAWGVWSLWTSRTA